MTITVNREFYITHKRRGAKQIQSGVAPDIPLGPIPRVARLMALAICSERLLATGIANSQAELAERGQVTTARMAQIMMLLNLAPDVQEAVLFLPRIDHGGTPITETEIRPITATLDWRVQRKMWDALLRRRRR